MPNPPTDTNYFAPPPLEDPLPLDGPWGPPRATWANSMGEGHPMVDPLGDGAWRWTTSPPSMEMGTTTITITMLDPRPELKIHRTIPTTHWPGRVKSTFRSPNPSPATTPRGLEDALDHRPDPDIFSAPATLLCATILAPDSPPTHLPSQSSTNLLLHTTLSFTDNPGPTLVDSSATNNFIDESLAVLAPHPLQHLPTSIPLKLFDGDPTPAGDITHCLEMTMTFANG
ncbi:hypothetical protein E4T56_gene5422 [Termitomyces sp. T112]|nr:hypothetical protein E4T56_gene5422 [Termitomyces sp. T112]